MLIREKIIKRTAKAGLRLPVDVADRLHTYFGLLRQWNRKVSLTALPVEDAGDEAIDRLLVKPILAARYLPKNDVAILDVGSGGGSPAIPMRIAAPGGSLRMVESKTRKAAFLREVIRKLEMGSAEVDAVRSEELPRAAVSARRLRCRVSKSGSHREKNLNRASIFRKARRLGLPVRDRAHCVVAATGTGLAHFGHHELIREWEAPSMSCRSVQARNTAGRSVFHVEQCGNCAKPGVFLGVV